MFRFFKRWASKLLSQLLKIFRRENPQPKGEPVMSALSIQPTYPIFTDIDGQPLEDGFVWVGITNLDPQVNPIAVFWDAALTIPAVQPIRTLAGYPSRNGSPARLYVDNNYSIRVMNKNGGIVYSAPSFTERYGDVVTLTNLDFVQAGTGAVTRSAQSKMREIVSVKDFGAVCDGVTDDAPSVQKAVDYCLTFDPPAILTVSGLCTLHTTVNIDRGNDASNASTYFIIKGDGIGGGFYAYYGVTMFSTTLTTGNPNSLAASQKIHFDNIVFKSEFPSNPTYVLDDAKFLRMKFTNCSFHRIKLLNATRYLQTYYLNNCMSYGWIGPFINGTNGAYDIKVDNHVAEAGTTFYSVVCNDVYSGDPNAQISITNSLFQSINSVCIEADRAQGFVVQNNYFEGNGQDGSPDLKFDTARNLANFTPNGSISVTGNFFSQLLANFNNVNYFSVRWGRVVQSGFAAGNYLVDLGTGAALKLHKTIPESRVNFMSEPGWPYDLYTSQFIYPAAGYVMPNTGERVVLVRGTIEAAGTITNGLGFTVTKLGTGQYRVNTSVPFSGLPAVVATPSDSNAQNVAAVIGVNSASQFDINFRTVAHAYVDTKFFFIAMGPA